MKQQSLTIIGLGVVGSWFAALAARFGGLRTIFLVDHDKVETTNVVSQNYDPREAGTAKAEALAERLAASHPAIDLVPIVSRLEDLPLGAFGGGIVVLALDNNLSRQIAAERCWMMGGTLLDLAVNADARLARMSLVAPSGGGACLQCGWGDAVYRNLATHTCRCAEAAPTASPAYLGAAVAAHGVAMLESLLAGDVAQSDGSCEWILAPRTGRVTRAMLTKNPNCRFDHRSLDPQLLDHDPRQPLRHIFAQMDFHTLAFPGQRWSTRWHCAGCGEMREVLRVAGYASPVCGCGSRMEPPPLAATSTLHRAKLSEGVLDTTVAELGLRAGEVILSGAQCFQLGEFSWRPAGRVNATAA